MSNAEWGAIKILEIRGIDEERYAFYDSHSKSGWLCAKPMISYLHDSCIQLNLTVILNLMIKGLHASSLILDYMYIFFVLLVLRKQKQKNKKKSD